MNDKYKVKIDNNDSRYVKLRKSLKDDISQKVQCEDYDKIIDYIFALVFEHNKPKEEVRKEMEEIFAESADYIMDLLVRLLEKNYGHPKDDNSSDLIEEIYEDKPSGSKSLSSQVVKPASHQDSKGSKNLYNQAINSVKESGRRRDSRNYQNPRNKYDQYEDQYGNQYNNNYQQDRRYNNPNFNNHHYYQASNYNQNYPNNNYQNYPNNNDNYYNNNRYNNRRNQGPGQNQYQQHNQQQRRKGSYNNQPGNPREENINVGGRNLVIKKRRDNKNSPSRSRSVERERSKERSGVDNSNITNEPGMNLGENPDYKQNYQGQPHIFGQNYQTQYPSDPRRQYINSNYFQPARGPVYQMRRLGPFNARGRFPGRFVKQRFLGSMDMARMPIMRKPFIRKAKAPIQKEGAKQEGQATTEQIESNVQEAENITTQKNAETPEGKQVQENQPQHIAAVESNAEEKDKKKIRCRNWPNCKNDNCEYAHPTETCQYFPKCQFGNKCLYIHPNIPCKYGFYCTRPGCSYSHGSGYNPGMFGMMPPAMQPFTANKFKKFHPKAVPKPGANPVNAASTENNQAESAPVQDDTQMVTDNNEQINA